jgi:hypothetical protein
MKLSIQCDDTPIESFAPFAEPLRPEDSGLRPISRLCNDARTEQAQRTQRNYRFKLL